MSDYIEVYLVVNDIFSFITGKMRIMKINSILALGVTSLVATSMTHAADTAATVAMNQMKEVHPRMRTMDRSGNIHKIVDKQLSTGVNSKASADSFVRDWAPALDVDANGFIERGPFIDGRHEQGLMYNHSTGEYKFTGYYYMQTVDGLPVYDSRLMVLVRNAKNYPAVSATTLLKDFKGFKAPKRAVASEAVALMAAATHLGRGTTVTTPELMVYAGTEKTGHNEPVAALVFQATNGGAWDFDNYRKFELVVDAMTGEVLYEKNLILHVDGNVSGMATESSGADVCEVESAMGMPYARVTLGGQTVYADGNGDFTINGSGNITSTLDGVWFNVDNQSGADVSLTQSDPYFIHNEANNNEQVRAQVNAYMHSNIVRDFTLYYSPNYPTIGNQQGFPVNTGVSGTCNAFYDYSSINFYNSGSGCSNTAYSVIVHHEYGHHLVAVAGSGQGEYGEGMGDVMGVLISGDPQLARGFYSNDCENGIRNADNNRQYGGSCSGIHDCGQLISGCVWDALETVEAAHPGEGLDIVASLAINAIMMHTGTSIDPSITLDWLTLDDDDGDLDNGTPHSESILLAMDMHSMGDIPEPLDNDFCSGAREVVDGNWDFSTLGALSDSVPYDESQCTGTYLGEMYADVWFTYVACDTGSMTVSTCNSITFDSDIVVYQGDCDNMSQVACNGDADGCDNYTSNVVFNVVGGETYKIRVGGWDSSASGSGTLQIDGPGDGDCSGEQPLIVTWPDGQPALLDPNGGTTVSLMVEDGSSSPADSGDLNYNDGSGWMVMPLDYNGSSMYTATFPAFDCGAIVDWYVLFTTVDGDDVTSPNGAPGSTFSASVYSGYDVVFDDDFQTDEGWTVQSDATEGAWTRVMPSAGGVRCDAPADADGSGMCYVTGNGGTEDVDGGTTTLYSPVMDASDSPMLSYYRWYSNGANCNGADPNNDYFYVDISSDGGGTWTNLETVGPTNESSGGWFFVEFDLSMVDGFEASDDFQVRYICGDLGEGSIIEAAVDGVELTSIYCDDDGGCDEDVNGDGSVNVSDVLEIISLWGSDDSNADVNDDGIVNVSDLLAVVAAWGDC